MGFTAGDLVVGVTYYNNRAKSMFDSCNQINDILNEYIAMLNCSRQDAIIEGKTAETLDEFISRTAVLKGYIAELGTEYKNTVKGFLKDIDKADDLLYESSFTGRKYLTDEEFKKATNIATHQEFSLKHLDKYLLGKLYVFVMKQIPGNTGALTKRLKNLDQKTVRKLNAIKENVRSTDQNYVSKMSFLLNAFENYKAILEQIIDIVNPDMSGFTPENIKKIDNTLKDLEKIHVLIQKHDLVSDESIVAFANNAKTFKKYFNDVEKVFVEYFKKNSNTITINRYNTIKEEVIKTFNEYSEDYVYSKERFDNYKKKYDDFLEAVKKYGDEWKKHFDEDDWKKLNARDVEQFESLLKLVGGAKKLSKMADDYIDVIYSFFFSMDESKKALEMFKKNSDLSDPTVKLVIEHVEALYNKEFSAYFEDIQKKIVDQEWDAIKGLLKNGGLVTKMLSGVVTLVSEYRKYHGVNERVDAIELYSWEQETQKAFDNSLEKLKKIDPNDSSYQEAIQSVRTCFDLAKKAKLAMLKKMVEASKGFDKEYYTYCYNQVKNASLSDDNPLNVLSRSQYKDYGSDANIFTDVTDSVYPY